jgi:hypothetical protein
MSDYYSERSAMKADRHEKENYSKGVRDCILSILSIRFNLVEKYASLNDVPAEKDKVSELISILLLSSTIEEIKEKTNLLDGFQTC